MQTQGVKADRPTPELLDVSQLAGLLGCSSRHCYRLSDAGKMPAPIHLGALVRWRLREIERWIADGCPAIRRRTAS